jgi:hypothetical protein
MSLVSAGLGCDLLKVAPRGMGASILSKILIIGFLQEH